MQLNITTDYAIRTIFFLCKKGGIISSKEISEVMKIPEDYVLKITRKLSKKGLVKSYIGKKGGFSANKSADEINLLDIIQAMENTIKINRCLEKDKFCSRTATNDCPIRSFYCHFQDELESRLASITIDDLLNKTYNTKEDKAIRL